MATVRTWDPLSPNQALLYSCAVHSRVLLVIDMKCVPLLVLIIIVWHCSAVVPVAPAVENHFFQGSKWAYTPSTPFNIAVCHYHCPWYTQEWMGGHVVISFLTHLSFLQVFPLNRHLLSPKKPFLSWPVLSYYHHQYSIYLPDTFFRFLWWIKQIQDNLM
jgi:hypothetical protein